MGSNPRAANADLTGVYYDATGDVACIIHADNDNFAPHQYPGLTYVTVLYAAYASAGPAFNFKGRSKHHALSKAIIAAIQEQHPVFAAIVQSRIDAFDAWFSDVAVKGAVYQAAFDVFWAALTLGHKVAWNNIDTVGALLVFLVALSAPERTAYDDMVAARQDLVAAIQGGPDP